MLEGYPSNGKVTLCQSTGQRLILRLVDLDPVRYADNHATPRLRTKKLTRVDHLFLLMGENPLPNLVASKVLLGRKGTAYLVHTQRTQVQAQNLAKVLSQDPLLSPPKLINIRNDQAEASVIRRDIQKFVDGISGSVGMNYTGGTKAMAVHAYRTLEQLRPDTIFSYLDSNTAEMIIDNDLELSRRFKPDLKLSLEQLFSLHGLEWLVDRPPQSQPLMEEVAGQLAEAHRSWEKVKEWRMWCRNVLRRRARRSDRWRSESELRELTPLDLTQLSPELRQIFTRLGAQGERFSLQSALGSGFESLTQVCEWLDGIWLEHHTLAEVQRLVNTGLIHDAQMSFRMRDPVVGSPSREKFEFDVAFMHQYQLFALSCTTATARGLCKQKLIEASVRARQLGGGEARVGLVCCHYKPDSLRSELEVAVRNQKIAVFGQRDLVGLEAGIGGWIRRNV